MEVTSSLKAAKGRTFICVCEKQDEVIPEKNYSLYMVSKAPLHVCVYIMPLVISEENTRIPHEESGRRSLNSPLKPGGRSVPRSSRRTPCGGFLPAAAKGNAQPAGQLEVRGPPQPAALGVVVTAGGAQSSPFSREAGRGL